MKEQITRLFDLKKQLELKMTELDAADTEEKVNQLAEEIKVLQEDIASLEAELYAEEKPVEEKAEDEKPAEEEPEAEKPTEEPVEEEPVEKEEEKEGRSMLGSNKVIERSFNPMASFNLRGGKGKMEMNKIEERAKRFVETKKTAAEVEELRSVLVSGGTLATPTEVDGINGNGFAKVSSIVDLVKVVNCQGMGSNKVAYELAGANAGVQTEGGAANASDPTFGFVTITPESYAVLSSISKQAKKQTPLQYEAKVRESALVALRKKAAAAITEKALASNLTTALELATLDEKALRKIAFTYGGSEGIDGEAYLFINKTDLITLGDVRGTSNKNAVYEITPDASNPNTGIIKDGGLSVRYCINSNLTAGTMLYGQPKNIELDLFSNYEIAVSEDFYFDKLMDAIRGDVELGTDVVVKDGLVKVTVTA